MEAIGFARRRGGTFIPNQLELNSAGERLLNSVLGKWNLQRLRQRHNVRRGLQRGYGLRRPGGNGPGGAKRRLGRFTEPKRLSGLFGNRVPELMSINHDSGSRNTINVIDESSVSFTTMGCSAIWLCRQCRKSPCKCAPDISNVIIRCSCVTSSEVSSWGLQVHGVRDRLRFSAVGQSLRASSLIHHAAGRLSMAFQAKPRTKHLAYTCGWCRRLGSEYKVNQVLHGLSWLYCYLL